MSPTHAILPSLSWETVLNKRENYSRAFDHWDARKIADYDEKKLASLLADAGIIRNRLKIAATISNARAYLKLCEEVGGLAPYLWSFVNGVPILNSGERIVSTELSDRISKDLKKRGFKFVGTTIIYAYMQAMGLVQDHAADCDWHHKNLQK